MNLNNNVKVLDYEGLVTFKDELDKVRKRDKLDVVNAINDVDGSIGDGILTIKRNGTKINDFSANQSSDLEINISVPVELADLENSESDIKNIIQYGLIDISNLTEELKLALHETATLNSGLVSENSLEDTLKSYGAKVYYNPSTHYILLLNTDYLVLSEFPAEDFIVDGFIENVLVTDGTGEYEGQRVLLIDFNTDSGLTDILIPISDIFNANNYTKTEDLNNTLLEDGFVKSVKVGSGGTEITPDSSGNIELPKVLTEEEVKNVLKYGQADVSNLTPEQKETAIDVNSYAKKVKLGTNGTPESPDSNGIITLSAESLQNIVRYGIADISGYTDEELKNLDKYGIADISGLTQEELDNLEKYGQTDVSELTDEEKEELEKLQNQRYLTKEEIELLIINLIQGGDASVEVITSENIEENIPTITYGTGDILDTSKLIDKLFENILTT